MDELHGNRAFSDSRGYTLYGSVANVADSEQAGNVGLEEIRVALERPTLRKLAVTNKVGTGKEKAALVAFYHAREPIGSRHGADKYEH